SRRGRHLFSVTLSLLRLLITRLERITPDSVWAHRASGLRGALLAYAKRLASGAPVDEARVRPLIQAAFIVLEQAAREKQKR
ncbi:hypothetical protein D6833_03125, partial [Candidatus Parcubacteria bacterium]